MAAWLHALHLLSCGVSPTEPSSGLQAQLGSSPEHLRQVGLSSSQWADPGTWPVPQEDHLQDLHRHFQLAQLLQAFSCWRDLLLLVPVPRHHPCERSLEHLGLTPTKTPPCSTYILPGPCRWEPFPEEPPSTGPQLLRAGMTPTAGTTQALKGLYSSWQGVATPDWLEQTEAAAPDWLNTFPLVL